MPRPRAFPGWRSRTSATTSRSSGRRATTASPSSPSIRSTIEAAAPARRRRRRAGALRRGRSCQADGRSCGWPRSICPTATRSTATNFPTSSPGWSGCAAMRRSLLALEEPLVLGGDYNVCPTDRRRLRSRRLARRCPAAGRRARAAFRALLNLGFTDAFRALHPEPRPLHLLGLSGRRAGSSDQGLRIDHLLLSPQAADRLSRRHRQESAPRRQALRPHACVVRAGALGRAALPSERGLALSKRFERCLPVSSFPRKQE